jgi:hypothetical protein
MSRTFRHAQRETLAMLGFTERTYPPLRMLLQENISE